MPGSSAFITSTRLNGEALPFGAEVTDSEGNNVGVVAQGGRIFARLKEDVRELQVNWGAAGKPETCRIDLSTLPARSAPEGNQIETFDITCLPSAVLAALNK
ncbi:FimD/PapC C-terminal domain-containing protein [Variovorax sp. Sphag1AA]|uniref:FimD/PapC C-terminal domain-containing protein n=1 Tax=Variovorax sp. Sphag1AA TaxID=2587027 RepID=UPI0016221175|nr:FimD/PapC C-terminal domain-containing protein [Variovorax sp. Sphag1AA]MBB3175829.1 outer membrane usher protein FimD/PapC [Variovorax sp. Sphag1AA]